MKPQRVAYFLAVVVLPVAIAACSGSSVPTEANARTVFENQLGKVLKDGTVRIIYFRKVNGQSGDKAGIRFYILDYKAEIEYPNGQNTQCFTKSAGWECAQMNVFHVKAHQKGEKIKRHGEITFEKTEKGWMGQDGNIY
jgi:hypothetical protein